jgi:hypothetical protein
MLLLSITTALRTETMIAVRNAVVMDNSSEI